MNKKRVGKEEYSIKKNFSHILFYLKIITFFYTINLDNKFCTSLI